jgi:hypothetical protein
MRRGTTLAKKEEESDAPKQQIKFDIFNEQENGETTGNNPDLKIKKALDNVSIPTMNAELFRIGRPN